MMSPTGRHALALAGVALACALATPAAASAGGRRTARGAAGGAATRYDFGNRFRLETNDFQVGRQIGDYRAALHRFDRSRNFLKRKGAEGRWIDMGAGSARAQRGFLRRQRSANRPVPQLLALGYKLPASADRAALATEFGSEHRYIEGLQGPRSIRALPPADLITDVMGIFTYYEGDKTALLSAYIDRLTPGGSALVHSYDLTALRPWFEAQAARGRIEYELSRRGDSVALRRLGGPDARSGGAGSATREGARPRAR